MPLILAVGMSQHWPVIGWSYGKPALYSAHAIVRALGALAIWALIPDGRFMIPFWVAAVYLAPSWRSSSWRREAAANHPACNGARAFVLTFGLRASAAAAFRATYGLNAPPGTAEATGLSKPSLLTDETPNTQSSTRMRFRTSLQMPYGSHDCTGVHGEACRRSFVTSNDCRQLLPIGLHPFAATE